MPDEPFRKYSMNAMIIIEGTERQKRMLNIELELRGECTDDFDELKMRLDALGSGRCEVRTMVMFFGEVEDSGVDVRCRVTNGKAEVVVKVGDYHAHDRREVAVAVTLEQMTDFARLFSIMGFHNAKVGTRESWEYQVEGVDVSLVHGMSGLSYIEFERMVESADEIEAERPKLEALAHKLGVSLWTTGEAYYAFCKRLTDDEDWRFTGSEEDMARLKNQIASSQTFN